MNYKSSGGSLLTWAQLAESELDMPEFWLDPYIPAGGITFLWGDTSIGKSPLTWAMASAIAQGQPFFGLPTKAAHVLYIEVDTPLHSLQPRLVKMPPAPNVWWLVMDPLSVPFVEPSEMALLHEAREASQPKVVFVNTLRKVHDLDDKESRTTKVVYSFFRKVFPGASLVFIHHMRKRSQDPKALDHAKEGFSGAKNWLNDAQVGLQLELRARGPEGLALLLHHRKTQVSEELRPMGLLLGSDGTTLSCPMVAELEAIRGLMASPAAAALTGRALDGMLATRLGVSPSTARRRRLALQDGEYPGKGFWRITEEGFNGIQVETPETA